MPFRRLVQELQPIRVPGRSSLFQAFIVYEPPILSPQEQTWQGLERSFLEIETGSSIYDLTLQIVEHGDMLTCSFVYNSDVFDAATIERMMGHFQNLLQGIVANPERRLSQLPMLGEAERAQLSTRRNSIVPDNALCRGPKQKSSRRSRSVLNNRSSYRRSTSPLKRRRTVGATTS
jgi:non-ribosomal peptide synthetase component F